MGRHESHLLLLLRLFYSSCYTASLSDKHPSEGAFFLHYIIYMCIYVMSAFRHNALRNSFNRIVFVLIPFCLILKLSEVLMINFVGWWWNKKESCLMIFEGFNFPSCWIYDFLRSRRERRQNLVFLTQKLGFSID